MAECECFVGVNYLYGWDGFERDPTLAAGGLRRAADQGIARAQWNLAQMYEDGEGVPRDPDEAQRLYQLAADQGHPEALREVEDYWDRVATSSPPTAPDRAYRARPAR